MTAVAVLAFAELEALTGTGQAVLLALLRARIAREQPVLAQGAAQLLVVLDERACDAEAQRAGLSHDPAASGGGHHVEPLGRLGGDERLANQLPLRLGREARLDGLLVDDDLARTRAEEDTGRGGLTTTRSVILGSCHDYATSSAAGFWAAWGWSDRKSTRLNSSH